MFICKICNKKFKNIKSFGQHLGHPNIKKDHNIYGTKEYYDLFIRKNGEGICKRKGCNNKTTYINLNEGYLNYCSLKCVSEDENIKKIRIEATKKSWKDPTNIRNSVKFRENLSKKKKKHWKDQNSWYNSKECSKIRSKYMKEIWSNPDGIFNTKEYRKIKSLIMKELWKDPNCIWRSEKFLNKVIPGRRKRMKDGLAAYALSFVKNPSKPQVELFKLTSYICPYVILNYPCLNYSIDIAVPKLSLAIEYDGNYWHQDKKYDDKRQKILEEEGWIFLRYEEYIPDIKKLKIDIENIVFRRSNKWQFTQVSKEQ